MLTSPGVFSTGFHEANEERTSHRSDIHAAGDVIMHIDVLGLMQSLVEDKYLDIASRSATETLR